MRNRINLKRKGIIFDLDDTLAKTKTGKDTALKMVAAKICNYLREKGVCIDLNELYKEIYVVAQKMDNGKKRILDRNLWWSFIIKKFSKGKPSQSFLDELTKNYWDTVMRKSCLYDDRC